MKTVKSILFLAAFFGLSSEMFGGNEKKNVATKQKKSIVEIAYEEELSKDLEEQDGLSVTRTTAEDNLFAQVTDLEVRMTAVEVGGISLDVRMTAVEVRDTALEIRDTALEVRDTALEVRVTAVEVRDTALEIRDTALEVRVTAVEVRDTALEVRVTALDVLVASLSVRETALEVRVTAVEVRDTALEIRDTALEVRMTAVEIRDTALEVRVTALEIRDTALEVRVTALENAGGGFTGSMLIDTVTIASNSITANGGSYTSTEAVFSGGGTTLTFNVDVITTTSLTINAGMTVVVNGDLIVRGALTVGSGATLTVYGDLIADGGLNTAAILFTGSTITASNLISISRYTAGAGSSAVYCDAALNANDIIFNANRNTAGANTATNNAVELAATVVLTAANSIVFENNNLTAGGYNAVYLRGSAIADTIIFNNNTGFASSGNCGVQMESVITSNRLVITSNTGYNFGVYIASSVVVAEVQVSGNQSLRSSSTGNGNGVAFTAFGSMIANQIYIKNNSGSSNGVLVNNQFNITADTIVFDANYSTGVNGSYANAGVNIVSQAFADIVINVNSIIFSNNYSFRYGVFLDAYTSYTANEIIFFNNHSEEHPGVKFNTTIVANSIVFDSNYSALSGIPGIETGSSTIKVDYLSLVQNCTTTYQRVEVGTSIKNRTGTGNPRITIIDNTGSCVNSGFPAAGTNFS